ncbi:MAG: hypothetical protein JJE16_14105 [Nitrospiraceae bacterium]|nr:hypothetical protein [Nitrospiraceae bacterium]
MSDDLTPADTRTDEQKLVAAQFPAAKESDFIIQYYPPGQAPPVLPKEKQSLDANARKWMAAMGLSREQGTNMATFIAEAIQQTHPLSANERVAYKERENVRLDRVLGPGWDDQLKPANRMIREVNALHPGFTDFVRAHGDNAPLIMELIKAATIYHARKRR